MQTLSQATAHGNENARNTLPSILLLVEQYFVTFSKADTTVRWHAPFPTAHQCPPFRDVAAIELESNLLLLLVLPAISSLL